MSFFFFLISYIRRNLFTVSLFYFSGVLFLSPEIDLGWRGFFLIWAYISGVFALVVYVTTFSSRVKNKTPLTFFFLLFLPPRLFITPSGETINNLYRDSSLGIFFLLLLILLSLLPPISRSFGPTVSCRPNIN